MERTRGQTLTIRVTFRRLNQSVTSVVVRTSRPSTSGPLTIVMEQLSRLFAVAERFLQHLSYFLGGACGRPHLLRPHLPSFSLSVLGDVPPTVVNFGNNNEVSQVLSLNQTGIWDKGVGVYDGVWCWQYRVPNGQWTEFQETKHRVYVVLDVPTAPWAQPSIPAVQPSNVPWIEALDFACNWPAGAATADSAAGQITRRIYDLRASGSPVALEYDEKHRDTHYLTSITGMLVPEFECTKFIDFLRTGQGNGRLVDCRDCANIVLTFANLLGCDLEVVKIGDLVTDDNNVKPAFYLNDILPIGLAWFVGGYFQFHYVAWKGHFSAKQEVFDACLQLDDDTSPATHTPVQPINLPFDIYRNRLATLGTAGYCVVGDTYRAKIK
jgi:hypothetical protein